MVIKEIKGASHADALPGGHYAALIEGSHFDTSLGRVPLPPGEPWGLMFVRASDVGGFHFAGLSHEATYPLVWEWRAGTWTSFAAPDGRGCYDQTGEYRDTTPAGYQYCDDGGNMVSRLDTYPVRNGLNEWTERAGIVVGQGNADGGIRVWAGNVLRRLLDGYYIFVNVNRAGPAVTICAWNAPGRVVVVDTTLDELAALPAVSVVVAPTPPPVTPIPQPPKPEPKPMPTIPESEIARAKAEIAAHPLGDNLPDMPWTEARVANLGGRWGLNGKRGNPNDKSHDIFAYRWSDNPSDQPLLVDVLGDGGGANIESFQILPWPEPAGAVWIAPKSVSAGPTTPLPTATGPGGQLDSEIRALLTRLATLETKVVELAARPVVAAPSSVSLAGARIALRTDNGHYLCAELGGGNDVHARRPEDGNPIEGYTPGTWETFTVRIQ
jgi:hypothetical protein